jgi:hypothetical protein
MVSHLPSRVRMAALGHRYNYCCGNEGAPGYLQVDDPPQDGSQDHESSSVKNETSLG